MPTEGADDARKEHNAPAVSKPLHHCRSALRWVLAWLALSFTIAFAAPVVQPSGWQVVCSSSGGKLVDGADGSSGYPGRAAVPDCPLCLPVDPAPGQDVAELATPWPSGAPPCPPVSTPLFAAAALLPPARAPPSAFFHPASRGPHERHIN